MEQNRELIGILDKRFLPGDSIDPFIEALIESNHEHVAASLKDLGNILVRWQRGQLLSSSKAAPYLIFILIFLINSCNF